MEQFQNAGPLERAFFPFLLPDWRFGQEWANEEKRKCRKNSPQDRAAPCIMAAMNRGGKGPIYRLKQLAPLIRIPLVDGKNLSSAENSFYLISLGTIRPARRSW